MKKVLKVLLIILLILILIVAGGFAYLYFNGMSGMSNTSEPKEGQIKIACAGDSTTYGHGISGWPKNNYPSVLQNLLGETYHVNNYGVSSFAVQEDADRSYRTLPAAFFLEDQKEGVTNHNIQPLIVGEIAEITRSVASERGYALIDIHALTAQHPEWFEKDGVHPSNEGAAAIAQEVYAVIRSK